MLSRSAFVRLGLLACFTLVLLLLYAANASSLHAIIAAVGWHKTTGFKSTGKVQGDKVIVMGKLQHDNTSWVQDHLPEYASLRLPVQVYSSCSTLCRWQNAIYTVDNTSAPLSTPRNKGREANPYLLYIIQHYHELPSVIAFLHSHRAGFPSGWHTDAPGVDNVIAMKTLDLDFVKRNGYVNMRCQWYPGCPDWVQPVRSKDVDDPENLEKRMPEAWRDLFGEEVQVPEIIATPCCAQFAVSKKQVLKRPREEYEYFHKWLMETEMSDQLSGRMFEYLWHIIFGKGPV